MDEEKISDEQKQKVQEDFEAWTFRPLEQCSADLKAAREEINAVLKKHRIPTSLVILGANYKTDGDFGTTGSTSKRGDMFYLAHHARRFLRVVDNPIPNLADMFG